jgi:hypothetical protein
MEIDGKFALLGFLTAVVLVLASAYFRLATALAKTDQVLVIWERIAETPLMGAFVDRIFTMFLKIRNPYTRSISNLLYLVGLI